MLLRWTKKHEEITIFDLPAIHWFFGFASALLQIVYDKQWHSKKMGKQVLSIYFKLAITGDGHNTASDPPTFVCLIHLCSCSLLMLLAISFVCTHCSLRMSDVGMHDFILTGATCWRGQTQTANNKMMRIRVSSRLIFLCNGMCMHRQYFDVEKRSYSFCVIWSCTSKICRFGVYLNWFLFWAIICGSLFIADSFGFPQWFWFSGASNKRVSNE